ncbi:phosphodiester glycosidase family protein [Paenibacillus oenotherae]|uniref:Phosphodiester glycosidase family protein n=1 Tax=Paenibacillus oenotherae TaxID=1435645 RepID=A0ABS7D570_9BACL|nr:stalk domain-containing protein [Paenibacillus oenotherae]MBW7475006.1 phosphodiester glycosidase family protein [Paenibacillus oenotherae]
MRRIDDSKITKRGRTGTTNKRLIVLTVGAALMFQQLAASVPVIAAASGTTSTAQTEQNAALQQIIKQREEIITSGAKLVDYAWLNKSGSSLERTNIHVIEIDLSNPYVRLDVMNGKQGTVTGNGSVASMVKSTGAVAGINADFFNTSSGKGTPIGPQVTSGTLLASPSKLKGMYAFAVTNDRKPIIDQFAFEGSIMAGDGSSFELAGINKAAYRTDPDEAYSHVNAMYIYTSAWTVTRPDVKDSASTPTEVLVQDGVVVQISENALLPMNPPDNGYILRTHGKAAQYVREHLQPGQSVSASYNLVSQSTGEKVDPASLQMLVGGHTILVDQGKASAFSRSVSSISPSADRARTAVGYSKDGTKAMLITIEDSSSSQGMTLAELQKVMVQLGIWKGTNLDGGGSTTMIARPLGDFDAKLAHATEYGTTQRLVANGIGVYTSAPQGEVKGIKVSGPEVLFIGQQATYGTKAYDVHYNPVDPGAMASTWHTADGLGTFNENTFTAARAGNSSITVKSGAASDKLPIEIISGSQISQMTVDASSLVLEQGKTITVPVRAVLNDGRTLTVPSSSVKWELKGFGGSIAGDKLTIGEVKAGVEAGYAIARYDGFSAVAVLGAGADKKFDDFEKPAYPITFFNTNNVTGSVEVVKGLGGRDTSGALRLSYDFTNGTGTKAAYAVLGASGQKLEGKPSAMTIEVLGDQSLNWLRAEFIDNNGKAHLVTIASQIDWSGWKQIKVNLPAESMAYPVAFKRLYVASIEEGQDERALSGEAGFDNISFQYPAAVPEPKRTAVQLKVGSKSAKLGGQPFKLDVAPLLLNGTSYLPLRFVADAMGAQINWEPAMKRVTVLRGDKLLEMWIGREEFLRNGVRMKAEVAPITRGGRTLVPLRLVSEQLGLTVNWEGKTGTITVE